MAERPKYELLGTPPSGSEARQLRRDTTFLLTFFCIGLFILYLAVSALPPMQEEDRQHIRRPRDIAEFHAMQASARARRAPRQGPVTLMVRSPRGRG